MDCAEITVDMPEELVYETFSINVDFKRIKLGYAAMCLSLTQPTTLQESTCFNAFGNVGQVVSCVAWLQSVERLTDSDCK